MEAAAADCLHRRSAQRLRGPAAELVRRPDVAEASPSWSSGRSVSGRFTAVAESLQQVRQHQKKLQELEQKLTYDSDPITQKKAFLETRALELLKNILSK